MNFWQGFFGLPDWFVMSFLAILLLGLIYIINELSNRKMKIDKTGVTFDRLREKKSFLVQLFELKNKKIKIEDLPRK